MQNKQESGIYPQSPPGYAEATGVPQPHFPPPQQPIYVVPPPPPQTAQVILVQTHIKIAPSFESYMELCPKCQVHVQTRVQYHMGFCSWTMLFLGIFVFFPLLCCFCLKSFQDAKHWCPTCGTLLAIKRR